MVYHIHKSTKIARHYVYKPFQLTWMNDSGQHLTLYIQQFGMGQHRQALGEPNPRRKYIPNQWYCSAGQSVWATSFKCVTTEDWETNAMDSYHDTRWIAVYIAGKLIGVHHLLTVSIATDDTDKAMEVSSNKHLLWIISSVSSNTENSMLNSI